MAHEMAKDNTSVNDNSNAHVDCCPIYNLQE